MTQLVSLAVPVALLVVMTLVAAVTVLLLVVGLAHAVVALLLTLRAFRDRRH